MEGAQHGDEEAAPPRWPLVVGALLAVCAIAVAVGAPLCYRAHVGASVSGAAVDWGVFGDFYGGFAGTIISFLAFVALLVTILIQGRALHQATKDSAAAREVSEKQSAIMDLQRFETTFFHLLENYYLVRDRVRFASRDGLDAFSGAIELAQEYQTREKTLGELYGDAAAAWKETEGGSHPQRNARRTAMRTLGIDILFLNGIPDKFRSYAHTLAYLQRFATEVPAGGQGTDYVGILKSQLTALEEEFLAMFGLSLGLSDGGFQFYALMHRDKEDVDLKLSAGRALMTEVVAAFHPSMRKSLKEQAAVIESA